MIATSDTAPDLDAPGNDGVIGCGRTLEPSVTGTPLPVVDREPHGGAPCIRSCRRQAECGRS
jgi:hypothetical protein